LCKFEHSSCKLNHWSAMANTASFHLGQLPSGWKFHVYTYQPWFPRVKSHTHRILGYNGATECGVSAGQQNHHSFQVDIYDDNNNLISFIPEAWPGQQRTISYNNGWHVEFGAPPWLPGRVVLLGKNPAFGFLPFPHMAVKVGDQWIEIDAQTDWTNGEQLHEKKWTTNFKLDSRDNAFKERPYKGRTERTDAEIQIFTDDYARRHPYYMPACANCQHFARDFCEFLGVPFNETVFNL